LSAATTLPLHEPPLGARTAVSASGLAQVRADKAVRAPVQGFKA